MTLLDSFAVRAVLVVGAGALSAAVCSAGLGAVGGPPPPVTPTPTPYPSPRVMSPAERDAISYLRRAVTAERTATYSGTKWLSSQASDGAVTVLEVRHDPVRGTWLEPRAPAHRSGHTVPEAEGADLDGEALTALGHHYTVAVRGADHSAGRPATVVEARGLGEDRVAGRFWLDEDTGLLLRRELYDPDGEIVRATAFVHLDVGPAAARVPGDRPVTDGSAARPLDEAAVAALRRDGWQLPDLLPGGMERYRAMEMTVDGHRVVQMAYSDGIFAASLFVERGRLDAASLRGFRTERIAGTSVYARNGLHRTLVWGGDGAVYTLLLDAPESLAPQLVAALPHTPDEDGVVSRLGRGIARVGSWANPFD
ncbi:MAG TPA: sigma-E factor regulatory protein RseB domain-containing protein [Mycobacteriales bacterium]|nr:sigma-E factor regulatory protein RseB domain-containing protein [Mycobacteriales bacterium]